MTEFTDATQWQRTAVQIATATGKRWVNGFTHAEAPGLAVTPTTAHDPDQLRHWSITHVLTGREIAEGRTERSAKRIALEIAPLARWVGPLEDMTPRGEEIAAAVQLAVNHVSRGTITLQPTHRRPSHATECERKAVRYLLECLKVHENRNDETAAARIRGALSYLDK